MTESRFQITVPGDRGDLLERATGTRTFRVETLAPIRVLLNGCEETGWVVKLDTLDNETFEKLVSWLAIEYQWEPANVRTSLLDQGFLIRDRGDCQAEQVSE